MACNAQLKSYRRRVSNLGPRDSRPDALATLPSRFARMNKKFYNFHPRCGRLFIVSLKLNPLQNQIVLGLLYVTNDFIDIL